MPNYLHRTTKIYLRSVPSAELPESASNYIEEPNLTLVENEPVKYWVIVGDLVTLADPATQASIDAAEEAARRDSIADEIDTLESYSKAFVEIVLDEFNAHKDHINAILDAIDAGNNVGQIKSNIAAIADYPVRTLQQLKTALRNKLNG